MAEEIPVYLFTGFMDSGKTTLVQETLFENNFGDGAKGVIIMCEDGEKEYNVDKLKTVNFQLAEIEKEEIILRLEVTKKLEELSKIYYDSKSSTKEKDNAALDAGELLTHEILYNTQDNTNKFINNE